MKKSNITTFLDDKYPPNYKTQFMSTGIQLRVIKNIPEDILPSLYKYYNVSFDKQLTKEVDIIDFNKIIINNSILANDEYEVINLFRKRNKKGTYLYYLEMIEMNISYNEIKKIDLYFEKLEKSLRYLISLMKDTLLNNKVHELAIELNQIEKKLI